MNVRTVTPAEFDALRSEDSSLDLIDVRTPAEFQSIHATPARLVPLDALDVAEVLRSRNGRADQPIYFICKSGSRAAKACARFSAAGFDHAINIAGGTDAWERAGLPVARGKKTMSLERQVRIAAGSLVVIGLALGWFVSPWFLALSALVGTGLVVSGITDTCGMGMLLARMPWNNRA